MQDVTFERHIDGDSTRVFSDNKSFSHLGRTASWSTSFNSNLDWNSHAEITEFGYTIVVDDSGSETKSESSGEHTYEPGEGEDPSGSYRPKGQDGGGGSGEGGGGDLEDGELGDMVRSSPAFDLFTQFMRPHWEKSHGDFVNVPHIINPGDPAPTAMNLKWYDWMRDEAKPLFVNAGEGDETFAPVPSLWKGQILEQKIPIVGYRNGENTLADRQTRANIDGTYKRPPNTTWHHVTFLL